MKYLFIIIVIFTQTICFSQNSINKAAIGYILAPNGIYGTGFVIKDSNTVITCAHLLYTTDMLRFITMDNQLFELTVVFRDSIKDFAILKSNKPITTPLKVAQSGDFTKIEIGAEVEYFGYDSRLDISSPFNHGKSSIVSLGSYYMSNKKNNVFSFCSNSINGYSGGPIFNTMGNVIGYFVFAKEKGEDKEKCQNSVFTTAHYIIPVLQKLGIWQQ